MRPGARSDGATDLAIGLVLVIGVACWVGLVAGQLGRFGLAPVGLAAAGAALVAWSGLRGVGDRDDPGGRRLRVVDGPLVLVLAALLYVPGYDALLFGSDATVYFATGAHLARTGSLAVDEPMLRDIPVPVREYAFPPSARNLPGAPAMRSFGGLVYDPAGGLVYSTFSQLPSVWLATGFAAGGDTGGRCAGALLAAGALMAFYLLVRRTSGAATAALAAALLGVALPQVLFARLPMGECGAQFFLWSALLAYDRFRETGVRLAALAAGVGFGLAGLARPEYILFLPLAVVLVRVLRAEPDRLPAAVVVPATLLFVHALVLVLFVVPSHYRHALRDALQTHSLIAPPATPAETTLAILAATTGAVGLAASAGRRAALGALLGLWAVAYVTRSEPEALGRAPLWLPQYLGWPVLVLALVGLPLLAARWRSTAAARLACALGAVVAFHFFYDIHTAPMPSWAARRLVPVVLPLMVAAAATATVGIVRRRAVVVLAALVALGSDLWNARAMFGTPYLAGASAATAQIAALVPPDAIVLVDSSLEASLVDVPLLLLHDRHAIQAHGIPGALNAYLYGFSVASPRPPVYVLRRASLVTRDAPGTRLEPVGEVHARLRVFGADDAMPFDVRAFRFVVDGG